MGDRLGIRGVLHSLLEAFLAKVVIFKGNNFYVIVTTLNNVLGHRLNDQAIPLEITL